MSLRAFAEGVAISVGQVALLKVALLEEIAASIPSFLPRDDSPPDIMKWNRYKIEVLEPAKKYFAGQRETWDSFSTAGAEDEKDLANPVDHQE